MKLNPPQLCLLISSILVNFIVTERTLLADDSVNQVTKNQVNKSNNTKSQVKQKIDNLVEVSQKQVILTKAQKSLINKLTDSKKNRDKLTDNLNLTLPVSFSAADLKTQQLSEIINSQSSEHPVSVTNNSNSNLIIADSNAPTDITKWSSARPDGHAPISVMGDHTHKKGEFMFSYRYMFMKMDGNRDGTDSLSNAQVLQDFMVTPDDMTMQMHMFGGMYAPSDNLTFMAMIPYVVKEMDHITRNGTRFTTNSEGFGDLKTSALYTILDKNKQRVHLNFGLSFPTGSIGERDDTPAGNDTILPYPMQIGSGTFDLLPGITYLGQSKEGSWGAQAAGTLRLGKNSNDYRLGNQFQLTGWVARNWTDFLSTSLRLTGKTWGNIAGADSRLNPNMIPTADPDRRAGTQVNVGLGVNLYAPEGNLKGSRLAMELELPILRDLDGPQLETDWLLTVGLQSSF
ncbi:MAG: transporter [Cyanobacteria bacterium P01_A01_bin.84]